MTMRRRNLCSAVDHFEDMREMVEPHGAPNKPLESIPRLWYYRTQIDHPPKFPPPKIKEWEL